VATAAKHMVKSLAVSKNAADDVMFCLSTYDPRLTTPHSSPETGDEEEESGCSDEEDDEDLMIASVEDVIHRSNSSSSASGMIEIDYLYAVDDAITAAGHSARASAVVHAAMPRLQEEARALLCNSSPRRASLSSDDHGALSPTAAVSVGAVAERMLRAGYGPELAQVYVAARHEALAEAVGVEPVSVEEVLRMEWAALDQRMWRWSCAVRPAVRTVLAGERRLCDEVFEADAELGRACFAEAARGCVLQLLGFAGAVAVSTRAIEKLFRLLGMYAALADVRAELEALFAEDAAREFVADEVSSAIAELGRAARVTIDEFGRAIRDMASRKPGHGGEIHPMTRYVLNYCVLLADSRETLDTILLCDADADVSGTPSARCMRELLTLLLRKMEDNSRLYDDAGLQNIFLMNNLYYAVQKVMNSPPLRELLGDDWLRRHRGQIRQYEAGYLRASWIAVLSGLRDDGGAASAAAHRTVRDQARRFNAAFEEMYRTQTAWKVSDRQLREELRIAVSERLIPAYRSFVGRASRLSVMRHVKYNLEDLENYVLDFFEGAQKFVR
jgi:exocyst complex component 7